MCKKGAQKHPPDTPRDTPKVTQTFQFFGQKLLVKVGSGPAWAWPGSGTGSAWACMAQAPPWPRPGLDPALAQARIPIFGPKIVAECRFSDQKIVVEFRLFVQKLL